MKNPVQGGGSGLFRALLAQPYLLLVLAPTFWGGNMVAGKLAVGQVDPYLLLLGRWAGAVLVLLSRSRCRMSATTGRRSSARSGGWRFTACSASPPSTC